MTGVVPVKRDAGVEGSGLRRHTGENIPVTGLGDTAVVEARDRIRAAILNAGLKWPDRRITVALLPADIRKVGSRFDLAMAVCIVAAAGEVSPARLDDVAWIAELGLDGRLRPVRGVLPAVLAAQRAGIARVVVARANGGEAALVRGVDVRVADHLRQVVGWLADGAALDAAEPAPTDPEPPGPDLADIAGQTVAKRALVVAAAGGHHLFLTGPPGAGKTMLAERLPGLLPPLDDAAAVEVTSVHSVAGALAGRERLIRRPPLQAPHHTATVAALVGGGAELARPGAISLAHHGVLFLDESPEFGSAVLEALREPIESGRVVLHRAAGSVTYPARFQLVLAANPCPCGGRGGECVCAPAARRRYGQKLSGPLLDRVDIRLDVEPVTRADLLGDAEQRETSGDVTPRIAAARAAAAARWQHLARQLNSQVPGAVLRSRPWRLPRSVVTPAEAHLDRGHITARGYDRILRLAWSIADLDGRDRPNAGDIAEAVFFRIGRREGWAA